MAFLSKYGAARHIYIPMIKRGVVDFAVSADWTPAAGDVKISKDGGAAANVTNLPTAITMGNTAQWDFSLTATEMQAAQVMVTVADSATKAVEDQMFSIETYGNASAQHAVDLSDSVRAGLTALPNAAAAAANGLPILGANAQAISFTAGMTISNAGGSALTLSSSGSNGNGLAASGNGSGDGISATGGATGRGIHAVGGATSGAGLRAEGTAGNSAALELAGQGSAAGLSSTGGATGNGATFAGGATSGHGLQATKVSGNEIDADLTGAITGNITGNLSGSVGSVTGLTVGNLDVAVSTRLASAGYTAPLDAAGTRTAVGLASANLDTQLSAIAGFIDTEVASILSDTGTIKAKTNNLPASPAATSDIPSGDITAIKAKTDSLAFTVAGFVDANVQKINDVTITGNGSPGTEFGV